MTKIQKDAITQRKNIMATKERIKRKYFEKHQRKRKYVLKFNGYLG